MRDLLIKSCFSGSVRRGTWEKLSELLRNNVPEKQALELLQRLFTKKHDPLSILFGEPALVVLFTNIIGAINNGAPIDVALSPWVPMEEVMLIRGGKKSGKLAEALLDCAELIEAKQQITSSIFSAIIQPIMMICLFIVLFLVSAFFVVPNIALLSDPETWTGGATAFYAVSNFVSSPFGMLVGILLLCIPVAVIFLLPYWTGPLRVKVDGFPPWSVYRLMTGSIWLFTVATLMKGKTPLNTILKDMLDSGVLRPWLRERVQRIRDRYQENANIGTILVNLNMNFPDKDIVLELAVYATMSNFDKSLYKITKKWLASGVKRVTAQTAVMKQILVLLMIACLCAVGLAIGSMNSQIFTNTGGTL